MAGVRSALIVATNEYDDERLAGLRSPSVDAAALAEVLGDPGIGAFEVTTVLNQPWHEVARAVAQFFRDRRPDDLVLLHFSCHGLKDDSGELYFAATDTSLDLLEATALASSTVNRAMDRSRAGRVLLFLDCCYAGAFARGMVARAGGDVDVNDRLGGRGRAVITASSAMQFAFEGDAVVDEAAGIRPSLFTNALVEGLRSGDADRDLDGWISLDELYAYVHDAVTDANPDQSPRKWAFDIEGDLRIARRGTPVATPAELPPEILESRQSVLTWERAAVVEPLRDLLLAGHPGRALAARLVLEEMASGDDSERVRTAARTALGVDPIPESTLPEPAAPEPAAPETAPPERSQPATPPAPPSAASVPPAAPSPRRTRRTPLVAGAAALVLVAVGVGYAVLADGDPSDSHSGTSAGALADADLVATQVNDGPRQVVVIPPDGDTRDLVDDPDTGLPTLNEQRDRMVVLKRAGPGRQTPVLVDDLSSESPPAQDLFGASAQAACPSASRPAWDPSGGQLAFVCTDLDKSSLGLWVADLDDIGNLPDKPLLDWTSIVGSPTWGGDGRIYFISDGSGGTSEVYWLDAKDPGEPQRVPAAGGDWLSHPDWCRAGLIYLRSDDDQSTGTIELYDSTVPGSRPRALSTPDPVGSPTWAPGCTDIAWLAPSADGSGRQTIWTAPFTTDGGPSLGTPSESKVQGEIGPPAWGSR